MAIGSANPGTGSYDLTKWTPVEAYKLRRCCSGSYDLAKCHIIEKHILRLNNVVGSQKKRLVAQH